MAYLLGREDSFLCQMRSEVYCAQLPVNSRYIIDLQKRNWKFEAGFHKHTGVSLQVPLPNHSRGGYPRVH